MKKIHQNPAPAVQQGANLTVQAGTNKVVIPEGYILVSQESVKSKNVPGSYQNPGWGKHFSLNQRKREHKELAAANGALGSAFNPAPAPAPAPVMVPSPGPAVAQPMGYTESNINPYPAPSPAQAETGVSEVEEGSAQVSPGYQTAEYARDQKLALRGASNLSAEMLLSDIQKIGNSFYSFSRVLTSTSPGSNIDVIKLLRYVKNGSSCQNFMR